LILSIQTLKGLIFYIDSWRVGEAEGAEGLAIPVQLHQQEDAFQTVAQAAMIGAGDVAEGETGVGDEVVVETQRQAVVQGPMAALLARPLQGVATGRALGATTGAVAGQAGVTLQQRVQVLVWEQV
jgi:hypothetical protein